MNLASDPTLQSTRQSVLDSMTEFLENEPSYDSETVRQVGDALDAHLVALQAAQTKEDAMRAVETTVLKLNGLNDKCKGDLIETDEREDLAAFIIRAGALRGFNRENEDVTEQWREW